MTQETFTVPIHGKPTQITIENDPPWYQMQALFKACLKPDGTTDMMLFFDKIMEVAIVSGINKDNLTELKSLPTSEMTKLTGEIINRIPLEIYLENLGMKDKISKLL